MEQYMPILSRRLRWGSTGLRTSWQVINTGGFSFSEDDVHPLDIAIGIEALTPSCLRHDGVVVCTAPAHPSDTFRANAFFHLPVVGYTFGGWSGTNAGESDLAAMMLDTDGTEVWRYQVRCSPIVRGQRISAAVAVSYILRRHISGESVVDSIGPPNRTRSVRILSRKQPPRVGEPRIHATPGRCLFPVHPCARGQENVLKEFGSNKFISPLALSLMSKPVYCLPRTFEARTYLIWRREPRFGNFVIWLALLDHPSPAVMLYPCLQNGTAGFDVFNAATVDRQDGSAVLAGQVSELGRRSDASTNIRDFAVLKIDAEGTVLWEFQVN